MKWSVVTLNLIGSLVVSCQEGKKESRPTLKLGNKLYHQKCFRCHLVPTQFSKVTGFRFIESKTLFDESSFFKVVENGKEGTLMKGFKSDLTKNEIKSVWLWLNKTAREIKNDAN